jgi:hypothetical protein
MQALEQLVEHRAEHRVRLFAILRPLYEQARTRCAWSPSTSGS